MQDLYIIGGSNSLLKEGWTAQLVKLEPELRVTNLSIGAATSLIGIYRILAGEIPDGATVVWEYALNEQNHFTAGQSIESLIYHLDWFLELCARRGIAVLPLIFWNREEMFDKAPVEYRQALRSCLQHRGLKMIDMKPIARQFSQVRERPIQSFYQDRMHYRIGGGMPRRIATAVRNRLSEAAVPMRHADFAQRGLSLHHPDRKPDEAFANRILMADLYPTHEGLTFDVTGHLLCCFLMSGDGGRALTVSADGVFTGRYSTRCPKTEGRQMRLMKHLVLWRNKDNMPIVERQVRMTHDDHAGAEVEVQNVFVAPDAEQFGQPEKIIAILIEGRAD